MKLKFTKMQGAGNDFVVIDAIAQRVDMTPALAQRIADRHFGIGCDQILLVERAHSAAADFRYRIFNADGGEVEQCGNGARCFVRFVRDRGLSAKDEIVVETPAGLIVPQLRPDGQVTVDMGAPTFDPARIPFLAEGDSPVQMLDVSGETVEIVALSMGNPHAVQVVSDADRAPVARQGPLIERHPRFPQRVNAGFMQVVDRQCIRLRVWERGVGETLACGTGACAAAVAGIRLDLLESPVRVSTRGGELIIEWGGSSPGGDGDVGRGIAPGDRGNAAVGAADGVDATANALNSALGSAPGSAPSSASSSKGGSATVRMTGPAVAVFDGEMEINER